MPLPPGPQEQQPLIYPSQKHVLRLPWSQWCWVSNRERAEGQVPPHDASGGADELGERQGHEHEHHSECWNSVRGPPTCSSSHVPYLSEGYPHLLLPSKPEIWESSLTLPSIQSNLPWNLFSFLYTYCPNSFSFCHFFSGL